LAVETRTFVLETNLNFLVTGAAGFLGSALANTLVKAGHQVRGLDDLSTGDPARLNPSVLFTRGDVQDRPKLWTLLQDVECVYHLAARVSVQESVLYPREYNDVNVGGTVSLVEAIRDVGVKRVVFASSATVYGPQPNQPVSEDARTHPQVPYAVSKLAAEYYIFALGELNRIETVALRIFNAYGPGQRVPPAHSSVIPLYVKNILSGASLVIHGKGRNSRDGTPVLKEQMARWLTRGALGRTVLAFCTAQSTNGGAGAIYVLLRR